jgi:hypothetical protein
MVLALARRHRKASGMTQQAESYLQAAYMSLSGRVIR